MGGGWPSVTHFLDNASRKTSCEFSAGCDPVSVNTAKKVVHFLAPWGILKVRFVRFKHGALCDGDGSISTATFIFRGTPIVFPPPPSLPPSIHLHPATGNLITKSRGVCVASPMRPVDKYRGSNLHARSFATLRTKSSKPRPRKTPTKCSWPRLPT